MKYIKFEKIIEGINPIIRVTYKDNLGRVKTRDAFKTRYLNNHYFWLDSDELISKSEPIVRFEEMGLKEYYINGKVS